MLSVPFVLSCTAGVSGTDLSSVVSVLGLMSIPTLAAFSGRLSGAPADRKQPAHLRLVPFVLSFFNWNARNSATTGPERLAIYGYDAPPSRLASP